MTSRIRMLIVAATAALMATAATAPAMAQPNNGGKAEKKSCTGPDGETYTHGSLHVSYIRVGKDKKMAYVNKCNDGKWESVEVKLVAPRSPRVIRDFATATLAAR